MQALLDETLNPLIAERTKGKDGKTAIDALLDLRIIDPACGSGHFLLAAARRLAVKCAELDKPGEAPTPADYRHWLREVARRSLYGVDKNPMAIELAKVALWIETVEPGKPLSFLDAHLRCGDALLGVYDLGALNRGIPDEAYKVLTGDEKSAATEWRKRNKAERGARMQGEFPLFEPPREVLEAARALETLGEDALAEVEAKAESFRALLAGPDRYRMEVASDLYCAAFLLPKTLPPARHAGDDAAFIPTSRDVWDKLAGRPPHGHLEGDALNAAKAARAFHWPLEFSQVFFPAAGRQPGFDLAIGNPPWDVQQMDEEEYFASVRPDIAKLSGQSRKDAILALEVNDPVIITQFLMRKHIFDASNEFSRASGRFERTAVGRLNTYALFAELFTGIAKRSGIVLPTGIATDATTAPFFSFLLEQGRLRSLYDFQTGMGFFDRIGHARFKFCLIALGPPERTENPSFAVAFFLRTPQDMRDPNRYFRLSKTDVWAINPVSRNAPVLRSKADAELTMQLVSRWPVLLDESNPASGNLWGLEFRQGLFNLTSDSSLFRTSSQLLDAGYLRKGSEWHKEGRDRYVPLNEGEYGHQFDHRYSTLDNDDTKLVTQDEHRDPCFEIEYRYWVSASDFNNRIARRSGVNSSHLLGFRRVARNTDERTVVAALLPHTAASYGWILAFQSSALRSTILCALFNSLVFDYCLRNKLSQPSIPQGVFYQTAAPPPSTFSGAESEFIVPRVLELTYTSHRMKPLAHDLGLKGDKPFPWDEDRRALLRAELDARIAKLYGLTRDQLRFILDPVDVYGPAYPSETFRVLQKNEFAKYGEYRTARLVLDAWDRLERGEL